jgi:hypothetical protein
MGVKLSGRSSLVAVAAVRGYGPPFVMRGAFFAAEADNVEDRAVGRDRGNAPALRRVAQSLAREGMPGGGS